MASSEAIKTTSSLIIKSNHLVNAEYRITPLEMKIIYLMSMQIKKGDEDFKTYYLRISDFKEDLGLKDNKALYTRMIKIVNRLMQRVIKLEDENGDVEQFHFITYSKHQSDNGTISIRFVPELKPHLLELKAHFTAFYDTNVLMLRSSYSMRIYEFLKQYELIGKRRMKVNEIKKKLELEDKYSSYNMFKKKVIKQAEKDLKKHCDIFFTFNEIKAGRKVDTIEFIIHRNRKAILYKSGIEEQPDHSKDEIRELLSEMGLTKKQITQYVDEEKRNPLYLQSLIEETKTRFETGKVKKPAAYLVKLIETGIQSKSIYEKKVEKYTESKKQEKAQKQQTQKDSKALIQRIIHEYKAIREQQKKDIITKISDEEMDDFEAYLLDMPPVARRDLITDGKLNRKAENFSHWLDIYVGSRKMENFNMGLKEWAKKQFGVGLVEDQHSAEGYKLVALQENLFKS